jgi:hypothetical protein
MLAFTLLALRCVNTFYSKRVKAVKIFPPLWNAISAFSFCGLYDIYFYGIFECGVAALKRLLRFSPFCLSSPFNPRSAIVTFL